MTSSLVALGEQPLVFGDLNPANQNLAHLGERQVSFAFLDVLLSFVF